MKLEPYPEYKDSGVEWIGQIPSHWSAIRIKWVATMESGHTPDKKIPEYWTDCDIPWVSLNDTNYLKDNDFITDTAIFVNEKGIANSSAHILPAGVVVFSRDATIGRCAITTRPMAVSQHFIAWVCGESIKPEFLLQVLRSMSQELDRMTAGATIKTIGMPDVKTLASPVPGVDEQEDIIKFIRTETNKIDALIFEQQDIVTVLREKRQAVISHAVTRGLNHDVLKKDSGVDWLGMIPEHWSVKALRHLIHGLDQGWSPQAEDREADPDEWAVIKLSAIKSGRFFDAEHKALSSGTEILKGLEIKSGDLLLTRSNTPELVGDVCVVQSTRSKLFFSDLVFRPRLILEQMDARFLMYFLLSDYGRRQVQGDARGSSQSMVKISQGLINAWMIPTPPLADQEAIADFLENELSILDRIISEAESCIALLQEHRTALISAVVTGKVDVREHVMEAV